jgi:hypothetical protein
VFPDERISAEAGKDLLRDQLRDCLDSATTRGLDVSGGWQTDVETADCRYRIEIRERGPELEFGTPQPRQSADDGPVYRSTYDWSEWQPSVAVVDAVTDASDAEATTLPRIYDTVDTDAIDSLVEAEGSNSMPVEVRFSYAGFRVTVDDTGTVTLDESPT